MQPRPSPPQAAVPTVSTDTDGAKTYRSTLISRNVTVAGHRTSVRLEPEMWNGFTEICRRERASLHEVCTTVAQHKSKNTSLTAAIRVFVMAYFRAAASEDGHARAGHGQGMITGGAVAQIVQKVFTPSVPMQARTPLPTGSQAMADMGYKKTEMPSSYMNAALPRR